MSGQCFAIVSIVVDRVRCRRIYRMLIVDSAEYRSGIESSSRGTRRHWFWRQNVLDANDSSFERMLLDLMTIVLVGEV